jgi:hypothetical protein
VIYMKRSFDSASCPTCDTLFERLPVEYDEDAGYVFLAMHPCADSVCEKLLCACCDQFHCDSCAGMSRESFPELPQMPAKIADIPVKTLSSLIARTQFAISMEESRAGWQPPGGRSQCAGG